MKIFIIYLALFAPFTAHASELLHLGRFSAGDLSGWSEKEFKGKTVYALVRDGDKTVLKAHSFKAASGLIKKVSVDVKKAPILRWSWKVGNLINKEDISRKDGEDFAARVYVVFPKSFWRMRGITYVWASRISRESTHSSPYTGNARIVVVESGRGKVGQWVKEERNILEDYRKLFGEEPPEAGAIAIMSDTDDTQEDVTAWYGDIFLSEK